MTGLAMTGLAMTGLAMAGLGAQLEPRDGWPEGASRRWEGSAL